MIDSLIAYGKRLLVEFLKLVSSRLFTVNQLSMQTYIIKYLFDGPPARTMILSMYVPPGGMPMQDPFARVSSVKSGRSSHASFELKTYTKNCSGILLKGCVSVGLA